MTFNGNGSFSSDYVIRRDGEITVSVVLARQGGFWGEYFNNAFLFGPPAWAKVDNVMKFSWKGTKITKEATDFVSIQWYGFILAPTSEQFTFILNGDDGFRFYFNEMLLIDRWDVCCNEMRVNKKLV